MTDTFDGEAALTAMISQDPTLRLRAINWLGAELACNMTDSQHVNDVMDLTKDEFIQLVLGGSRPLFDYTPAALAYRVMSQVARNHADDDWPVRSLFHLALVSLYRADDNVAQPPPVELF